MRTSLLRLAQNVSATPIPQMKAAVQSLLPPKVLYRRLLRAHQRHLPIEMRILGKYGLEGTILICENFPAR